MTKVIRRGAGAPLLHPGPTDPPAPEGKDDRASAQAARLPEGLSEAERTILRLLSADAPAHIDDLAGTSRLPIPALTGALLGLEMRDLVRQLPGKSFVRRP